MGQEARRGMAHDCSVLIGIVTLNRKEKLVKTLDECRTRGFTNIVVLDNGSRDGTRELLAQQPSVEHIFNKENEGGSGGFNRIMHHFMAETTFRWLFMFDDDAYPTFTAESLERYLQSQGHLNLPGYTFRVTYPDGGLCEMNRPGFNVLARSPFRMSNREFHVDGNSAGCRVDFASFVGILLSRETIQKVGIVSKEFFIYSDDTYYTLTISEKLGGLFYYPSFALVHDCGRSSRKLAGHSEFRLRHDVVNKIVLIRRHSKYPVSYSFLYVVRLIAVNPTRTLSILSASVNGLFANLDLYRNEPA